MSALFSSRILKRLAVRRSCSQTGERVNAVLKPQSKIYVGDRLICYGKLENLKELFLEQGQKKGGRND
jgi:hypothetical protein